MEKEKLDKLKQIFMEIFSINESEIESYRMINNKKWDSLASVMLIAALESEFEIIIEEADYESFTSFAAIELVLENSDLTKL
jgi:acyl carrier protein